MTGLEQFLSTFGDITIAQIVTIGLAFVFLFLIYKQIKKYVTLKIEEQKKHDKEEEIKNKKIDEAWNATQKLEAEIQEIREGLQTMIKRFDEIEVKNKKRECSKLKDLILRNYRFYTNKEQNPSQSWTRMESEAFWELFREYEDAGGDGYMHTVVQPEMQRLIIIEVG